MMRPIFLIFLPLLLAAMAGCRSGSHEKGAEEQAPVIAARDLSLVTVKTETVPETAELTGTVRAGVSALVASRIPGTVAQMRVREGDRVNKGQVVAVLDADETLASAAVASAGVDEAGRALNEARVLKQLADSTFGRFERLYNEQAVTRQEFETRENEKKVADQGVARAEARLRQAREASRAASVMAGHTRVTAPVTGIVTSRKADLGSTVFPGQPLLTIENERSYRLELTVPESLSLKVRPGLAVGVSLDALDKPWDAAITEVTPAADPASRTFIAKVPLNRQGLRSGLFGRGAVSLDTRAPAMLLPRGALVERGGLTSVWVLGADNRLKMRLVKAGRTTADHRIEILSGLQDGEKVVTAGLNRAAEGAMVK